MTTISVLQDTESRQPGRLVSSFKVRMSMETTPLFLQPFSDPKGPFSVNYGGLAREHVCYSPMHPIRPPQLRRLEPHSRWSGLPPYWNSVAPQHKSPLDFAAAVLALQLLKKEHKYRLDKIVLQPGHICADPWRYFVRAKPCWRVANF